MFSLPKFDDLLESELSTEVDRWLHTTEETTSSLTDIEQAYNLLLPRTAFFKSLPTHAKILDVGAGDGTLAVYKDWPLFKRPDIKMYALSLSVGDSFHLYEGFEIKDFEVDQDIFPGLMFDAINCAHFIEHMSDPKPAIEFMASRLRPGGRLYLEWPHPLTKKLPSRHSIIAKGFPISTFNFADDNTHVETWPAQTLLSLLESNGLRLEGGGRVYLPWVAKELRDHSRANGSETGMTLAAWAAFGWAQYMILNRV